MLKQVVLCDENCVGHGRAIAHALTSINLHELLTIELRLLSDVGLSEGTDDESVWRLCQENRYLLLSGNRTAKDGTASLEMTVRRLVTEKSLPVVTIGDMNRVLRDSLYCQRCAERLAEIIFDLDNYRGITRVWRQVV